MEIKEFKSINKGCLIASFNVIIPEWEMTIRNVCYMEKEGKSWIQYPSNQYTNAQGEKKSYSYIVFGERVGPRLTSAIKEQLKKYLEKDDKYDELLVQEEIPF